MADRQTKVTLSVQMQQYVDGMRKAAQATRETATEADKLTHQREAFQALGTASVVAGGLLAAGLGVAVAKMADFEQAMSNVQASTHESTENMGLLRQAALDAGVSTVFSATEAANAIEELAKAGVSTQDIIGGGLASALDLAAAGNLSVARSAEITATALNQFNLSGEDAAQVSDVLAAGAGKAMGSVEDLANGLKFVGPVANSMGVSLEETTGVLALFAQQGIIGEQAGTSLRGVLASLTSPSAQAREEIERLGISLYDSSGSFLGLQNAAGELSRAYTAMDGASRDASLGIIFGRETVTAATTLYKAGAAGVDEWTQAVDDSGYAAETARMRLDNLKGDVEALGGAFETALIETGSAGNDALRGMVQTVTALVDVYNDLPDGAKATTLAVGGATAAVTLAGGTALLAVPKFLELRSTLQKADISMGGLSLKAGAAGLALGGLFAIVGELARKHAEARAKAESYADAIQQGADAVGDMTLANLQAEESWLWVSRGSAADAAEKFGFTLRDLADAAEGDKEALKAMNDVIAAGEGDQAAATRLMEEYGLNLFEVSSASSLVAEAIGSESAALAEGARILRQKKDATEEEEETTRDAAQAYVDAATEVSDLNSELSKLIDTINEANGVGQDAVTANLNYRDALAEVDAVIAAGKAGWDENTQAGRDNRQMLVDLAKQAQDAAKAQFDLDGNTDTYRATLEASRQALIDRAEDLGANADEAAALADQIFRIPSETEWELIADTSRAQWTIQDFLNRYGELKGSIVYRAVTTDGSAGGYATGGRINGPGTTTSDSIPIMASDEEHMLSAAEVRGFGGHGAVEAMRADARAGRWEADRHWVPAYAIPTAGGATAAPNGQLSLEGLTITGVLEIGGDGLARIIDGQIAANDAANARAVRRGVQRI